MEALERGGRGKKDYFHGVLISFEVENVLPWKSISARPVRLPLRSEISF